MGKQARARYRCARWWSLRVSVAGALLLCLGADDQLALQDAALRATADKRYCDASFMFLQLYTTTGYELALYRAAEVAYAADDRQLALRLYRTLMENHPDAHKAATAQGRVADLRALLDKGPGVTCVLPPRTCGDWLVAPGETCDDGNIVDGDGCDGNCALSACGNGVRVPSETCDDGNVMNGDGCDANCTPTACGNAARSEGEACDDGNAIDGDGCDGNCTLSACGNGVRGPSEMCDDGNLVNGDACTSACIVPSLLLRPPSSPPLSSSVTPWPLLTGGGGLLLGVVGGAGAFVGTLPLSAHAAARRAVEDAELRIDDDPVAALRDARAAQAGNPPPLEVSHGDYSQNRGRGRRAGVPRRRDGRTWVVGFLVTLVVVVNGHRPMVLSAGQASMNPREQAKPMAPKAADSLRKAPSSSAPERVLAVALAVLVLGPFVVAVVRPFEAWPWTSAPMYAHKVSDDTSLWRFHIMLELGGREPQRELDWRKVLRMYTHHAWRGFFADVYGSADPESAHAFRGDDAERFEARCSAWFARLVIELAARDKAPKDIIGVRLQIERVPRGGDKSDHHQQQRDERRVVGRFDVAGGRYVRAQEWP